MALFWHGTSTTHLDTIKKNGLQPPVKTGQSTEKRKDAYDTIFLTSNTEEGRKYAEGYAIRAAQKFGGEPVVLCLELDEAKHGVRLERKGRVDQWVVDHVPSDCIAEEIRVPESGTEKMVEIFKSVRHKVR